MMTNASLRRRVRAGATAGLVCVLAAGCATNPVTGRRQLALVSEAQEIQMGQQAAQEVAQQLGLVENQALQQYVQRGGRAAGARVRAAQPALELCAWWTIPRPTRSRSPAGSSS